MAFSKLVPGNLNCVVQSMFCLRSPTVMSICGAEHFKSCFPIQATESSTVETVGWPETNIDEHQSMYASIRSNFDILPSHDIKVILIGDACTGKSALLELFAKGKYDYDTKAPAHGNTVISYKDNLYVLNFWDRPGDGILFDHIDNDCQEFYKDANAALVVYDLIRLKDTLPNALKWKARVDSFVCKRPGESIPMFLLGNKCDLKGCFHDASHFTELHGFKGHFRTSAKMRVGIDRALEMLVREVVK